MSLSLEDSMSGASLLSLRRTSCDLYAYMSRPFQLVCHILAYCGSWTRCRPIAWQGRRLTSCPFFLNTGHTPAAGGCSLLEWNPLHDYWLKSNGVSSSHVETKQHIAIHIKNIQYIFLSIVLSLDRYPCPRPGSIAFRTSSDGVSHHGPSWLMGGLSEPSLAVKATDKLSLLPEHSGYTHAAGGCSLATMESVEMSVHQVS